MKILLTGATGFIGREVLAQLARAGHQVRILARSASHPTAATLGRQHGAEVAVGSILDEASLREPLAGMHAVVHLVGIISEVGAQTFEAVHARGTASLVSAARRAGVRRFVHMSALGTRPNAASRYHQTKFTAEETVRNSGFEWTIHRPSVVYGPGDRFVNLFASMSRWSPFLPVIGPGTNRLQPVAVELVGRVFAASVSDASAGGRIFEVCGPQPLTLVEILGAILRVCGRRRSLVHIPLPLARAQAAVLEVLFPFVLRRGAPLTRDQLIMLQEDNTGDPTPATQLFGLLQPRFEEGIARWLK